MNKDFINFAFVATILTLCSFFFILFSIYYSYSEKQSKCKNMVITTKCYTQKRCVSGIMIPGFCLTEEEIICHDQKICLDK